MIINAEKEIPYFKDKVRAVINRYQTSKRPAEIVVMRVSGWPLEKICSFYAYKDLKPIYSALRYALYKTQFDDVVMFAIDVTKHLNKLFLEGS
jgi:uncharacterized protein (DUF433 family)